MFGLEVLPVRSHTPSTRLGLQALHDLEYVLVSARYPAMVCKFLCEAPVKYILCRAKAHGFTLMSEFSLHFVCVGSRTHDRSSIYDSLPGSQSHTPHANMFARLPDNYNQCARIPTIYACRAAAVSPATRRDPHLVPYVTV